MRVTLWVGLTFLCVNAATAEAQLIGKSYLEKVANPVRGGNVKMMSGAACLSTSGMQGGTTYNVRGSTATIPITFGRVEKGSDGQYQVGSAIDLGYGYMWFSGAGTYGADGTMLVEPAFFGGFALNTGVRNSSPGVGGSASVTGFIGLSKVALSVGYDVVGKSPIIGIATKIDVLSFKKGSGADLCVRAGQY